MKYDFRCWSSGKTDKLRYLKKVKMWYLQHQCTNIKRLIPNGDLYIKFIQTHINNQSIITSNEFLPNLANRCCSSMKGSL